MAKLFRYAVYLSLALILAISVAYWVEDGRVEELDFIPTYDKQDELEALFKKATEGTGLTPEEAERLNWLISDKKDQVNQQVGEWLEGERSR